MLTRIRNHPFFKPLAAILVALAIGIGGPDGVSDVVAFEPKTEVVATAPAILLPTTQRDLDIAQAPVAKKEKTTKLKFEASEALTEREIRLALEHKFGKEVALGAHIGLFEKSTEADGLLRGTKATITLKGSVEMHRHVSFEYKLSGTHTHDKAHKASVEGSGTLKLFEKLSVGTTVGKTLTDDSAPSVKINVQLELLSW